MSEAQAIRAAIDARADDGRRATTLNGKYSSQCGVCGLAVYCLWVDENPPPIGCAEGHDSTPWKCGHVLSTLQMAVISIDYLGGQLLPHHEHIIRIVGQERADAIMAYIREHNQTPPSGKMRDPDYSITMQ